MRLMVLLFPPLILLPVAVPAELMRKFPAILIVAPEPAKVVPVPPKGANVKFFKVETILPVKA